MKESLFTLELRIAKLLRYGVGVAGSMMLVGWISLLDFRQNPLVAFHDYQSLSLGQSLNAAIKTSQWGLLVAYGGLVVLISLPLLRVLLTGVLFLKQKERLLSGLAFFVFAILILSFTLGIEL